MSYHCHWSMVEWTTWWALQLVAINCLEGTRGRKKGPDGGSLCKKVDCTEQSLKNTNEQVESLWVKFRGQASKESFVVDVYYFQRGVCWQSILQEASCSQTLILLGDVYHPDVCWKSGTASCQKSKRVLECAEDNFLIQGTAQPQEKC